MNRVLRVVGPSVVLLAIAACNGNGGSSNVPRISGQSVAGSQSGSYIELWGPDVVAACPDSQPGQARCLALIRTGPQIVPDGGSGPGGGYTPSQLQAAYNLPSSSKGTGQIVAIVDAYDNPNVASDLARYRKHFHLPKVTFTKYNQDGQSGNYPPGNTSWGLEEDLDVDMVSASCPNCSIDLVEATTNSLSDLQTAVAEAVTLGAHIVSNSYFCFGTCGFTESYYDKPSVTYLAAAGDFGYGTGLPMGFGSVVAVGGTSLYTDSKTRRGFREGVWHGTGSGCASGITKPSWQHDPGCSSRTANDVGADADPATGVAEYDTYGYYGGWIVVGGTSAPTPFLAGVFALAGNATSQNGGETFWKKNHESTNDLYRVASGSDGSCSPTYLCTDGTKEYKDYGGPTGWGTPNGIGAF